MFVAAAGLIFPVRPTSIYTHRRAAAGPDPAAALAADSVRFTTGQDGLQEPPARNYTAPGQQAASREPFCRHANGRGDAYFLRYESRRVAPSPLGRRRRPSAPQSSASSLVTASLLTPSRNPELKVIPTGAPTDLNFGFRVLPSLAATITSAASSCSADDRALLSLGCRPRASRAS